MKCSSRKYVRYVLANNPEGVVTNMVAYGHASPGERFDRSGITGRLFSSFDMLGHHAVAEILNVPILEGRPGHHELMNAGMVDNSEEALRQALGSFAQTTSNAPGPEIPIKLPECITTINWKNCFYVTGCFCFLFVGILAIKKIFFK